MKALCFVASNSSAAQKSFLNHLQPKIKESSEILFLYPYRQTLGNRLKKFLKILQSGRFLLFVKYKIFSKIYAKKYNKLSLLESELDSLSNPKTDSKKTVYPIRDWQCTNDASAICEVLVKEKFACIIFLSAPIFTPSQVQALQVVSILLNFHKGDVYYYRGSRCLEEAFINGIDRAKKCSLHRLEAVLDGGRVVEQFDVKSSLTPSDGYREGLSALGSWLEQFDSINSLCEAITRQSSVQSCRPEGLFLSIFKFNYKKVDRLIKIYEKRPNT